jgi:uncharacterized protein
VKKNLILLTFLLLLLNERVASQNGDVEVKGIPFKLFWENMPMKFSNENAKLVIEAGEKTDMFRDPNATYNTDNAPKLLFEPDSNFVLSTRIDHLFSNKWDGGAIVLKADSANWVKFCYEKDYTGARRVVSVVTKDISDDCNSVSLSGNSVYFKMAKAGKVITLYYSVDQKSWILVRHFQFESNKPLVLGFLAQSPTGKKCTVTFTDIKYESKKIKDPYAGE